MEQRISACWGLVVLDMGVAIYLVDQGVFAFRALSGELEAGASSAAPVLILLVHLVPAGVMAISAFLLWRRVRFRWFVQSVALFFMLLMVLGYVLFEVDSGTGPLGVDLRRSRCFYAYRTPGDTPMWPHVAGELDAAQPATLPLPGPSFPVRRCQSLHLHDRDS